MISLPKSDEFPGVTPRETLLLLAIGHGRRYGLEIVERIKLATDGAVSLTPGSLYPCLSSMKNKGLISQEWGEEFGLGARRCYHTCTPLGLSYIEQLLTIQRNLLKHD
jgi:DNA-binding PadR family transcriptional regulator